jgi:hypothetical protein
MATHPPKKSVVFRNFNLSPALDLWVLRFCSQENLRRSVFFQNALFEVLERHCPALRPSGSLEEILQERWKLKGTGEVKGVPNGPSSATLEESSAMKLYKGSKNSSK